MKKSLASTLIVMPLLSLSSMVFAAEPAAEEPLVLSSVQMDDVTAGRARELRSSSATSSGPIVWQANISPVIVVQIAVLNNGDFTQAASIVSGNFASILQ